jgi:hypothetical protein
MWYILLVILFGADPSAKPVMLEPQFFASSAKCEEAGTATIQAIKDANLTTVAAAALSCKAISNPVTEHSP